ncbi:MAG: coenzyme F420-0:L-glutamate ligase [Clostridia bacterium]
MERRVGTIARGIRCPIIREGDDLAQIVVDSVLEAAAEEGFSLRDRDVISITESIAARAQGNYATVSAIASDVKEKLGGGTIGVIFPILSRNRFAICLRGIAQGAQKVVLMLSYPSDEVGNALVSLDQIDTAGVNPYTDLLTLKQYRALFGENKHPFTGVDYVQYYGDLIREAGADCEIIFANDARRILEFTKDVLCCDIHSRARTKRLLRAAGARRVFGLDDILNASVQGSGYNSQFGLLGSNKSTEDKIKLFPQDCSGLVLSVQKMILEKTGRHVEVMVYGDGAFKDPVGKIWELADPCVSAAHTPGLEGTPNEIKLKYLADNDFAALSGEALQKAIEERIKEKKTDLVGDMASQGTTPRRLTDLIGSLCDLTSGSGDKGTPVVLVQGYFDNYTN